MPFNLRFQRTASLALAAFMSLGVGCSKEEAAFQEAQSANTIEAYESFLKEFPENSNQVTVEERLDQLYYEAALKEKSEEAFKAYIERYPKGKHAPEIKGEYEQLLYKKATKKGDKASYEAFLKAFPRGNYTAKAQKKLEEISYFTRLSVSDVKVEKVNMEGDRRGPENGWQITGAVTNTGDKALAGVSMSVGPKGGEGAIVAVDGIAVGEKAEFTAKTAKAPEGWDETTVAVDFKGLKFAPVTKQ